jgi:hypothetical protein
MKRGKGKHDPLYRKDKKNQYLDGSIARAGKEVPTASSVQPRPISQSELDDFNEIKLLSAGKKKDYIDMTPQDDDEMDEYREDLSDETEYGNVRFSTPRGNFICSLWQVNDDDPTVIFKSGDTSLLDSVPNLGEILLGLIKEKNNAR